MRSKILQNEMRINYACEVIASDGDRLDREEYVRRVREDLASGGYELHEVEWNDDTHIPSFVIIKTPEGLYLLTTFPYIGPSGIRLYYSKAGGHDG